MCTHGEVGKQSPLSESDSQSLEMIQRAAADCLPALNNEAFSAFVARLVSPSL